MSPVLNEHDFAVDIPSEQVRGRCVGCERPVSIDLKGHCIGYDPRRETFYHYHQGCREYPTPIFEAALVPKGAIEEGNS